MIDTHCHLNDLKYKNVGEIVNNFLSAGVTEVVCVGCDPDSNKRAKEIAQEFDSVFYAVGIHPDDCNKFDTQELENYLLAGDKKLVAVGEIGLDYFHNTENKQLQQKVFASQIELAKKFHLPFIIHCRDAYGDTLEILKAHAPYPDGAVMHCYSGSWDFAKEILKLNIKISFTGSVTFKNAKNVQNVAQNLPDGSFFFETDSPYLSPEPVRGTTNEPKNVIHVANFVAGLRGEDAKTLVEKTDKTAKEFFKIY